MKCGKDCPWTMITHTLQKYISAMACRLGASPLASSSCTSETNWLGYVRRPWSKKLGCPARAVWWSKTTSAHQERIVFKPLTAAKLAKAQSNSHVCTLEPWPWHHVQVCHSVPKVALAVALWDCGGQAKRKPLGTNKSCHPGTPPFTSQK